jgi:hypothetical protein
MSTTVSQFGIQMGEFYRRWGIETVSTIRMTTSIIALTAHAIALYMNYKRQKDAQHRQLDILQDIQARRRLFWALEIQMLGDYGDDGNPGEDPLEPAEYGSVFAGRMVPNIAYKYEEFLNGIKCNAGKYQTSALRQNVAKAMRARAVDISNMRTQAYFLGAMEYRAKDELYFQRRYDTVAMGAGLLGQASEMAAKAAAGFGQQVAYWASAMQNDFAMFNEAAKVPPASLTFDNFHSNIQSQLGVSTIQQAEAIPGTGGGMVSGGSQPNLLSNTSINLSGGVGDIIKEVSGGSSLSSESYSAGGYNFQHQDVRQGQEIYGNNGIGTSSSLNDTISMNDDNNSVQNCTSNSTLLSYITGDQEPITPIVNANGPTQYSGSITSQAEYVGDGSSTKTHMSSSAEGPHSPATWQDRVRYGQLPVTWPCTCGGTVTIWLDPYPLVYADDIPVYFTESGMPI